MSLLNTPTSSCVTAFRSNQHPTLSRFTARTEHKEHFIQIGYIVKEPCLLAHLLARWKLLCRLWLDGINVWILYILPGLVVSVSKERGPRRCPIPFPQSIISLYQFGNVAMWGWSWQHLREVFWVHYAHVIVYLYLAEWTYTRRMFCAKLKELKLSGECPFSMVVQNEEPRKFEDCPSGRATYELPISKDVPGHVLPAMHPQWKTSKSKVNLHTLGESIRKLVCPEVNVAYSYSDSNARRCHLSVFGAI